MISNILKYSKALNKMDVIKILIVGESRTGKTSIVSSFLGEDPKNQDKSQSTLSMLSAHSP
jgi:GTPase SAR1 family protein